MCLHNLILIIQCSLYYSNKVICHKEAGTATRWRRFNIIPLLAGCRASFCAQLAVALCRIIKRQSEKKNESQQIFDLIRLKKGTPGWSDLSHPLEGLTTHLNKGIYFLRDLFVANGLFCQRPSERKKTTYGNVIRPPLATLRKIIPLMLCN